MPTTEIGIDVQTISVERKLRRKQKMISVTRPAPMSACSCTEWIDRLMYTELSSRTFSLMFGISRLMRSISALTPSATCTVLVPDCFCTDSRTPGRPLIAKQRADVFGRVLHLGDVADVNRHAIARHQNQIPDLVEALELRLAAEQVRAVSLVHLAERRVFVLGAEQRDDALDRQVERRDLFLRQLDVNLPPQAAVGRHGGDAVDALEARADLVLGHFAQRDAIVVALDAEAHDRHRVRVLAEDRERFGIFRQAAAHAVEAGPQVVHGFAQVGAPGKRQPDDARTFLRRSS